MIFTWSITPEGVRVSHCDLCTTEVARSRSREAVFRAQRAHASKCIPTVPAHLTRR